MIKAKKDKNPEEIYEDLLFEGVNITKKARILKEIDELNDLRHRYINWFIGIKKFVLRLQEEKTLLDPRIISLFYETNDARSNIDKMLGLGGMSDIEDEYAQKLLGDIKAETEGSLANLRKIDLKKNQEPGHLISRNNSGNYSYDGKSIKISKETIYYKIFDILFCYCDQEGFLSYEDIEKYLVKAGESSAKDEKKREKRISNAMSSTQGLFKHAKINGHRFLNQTHIKGNKLIETRKGRGLKLNNPLIT